MISLCNGQLSLYVFLSTLRHTTVVLASLQVRAEPHPKAGVLKAKQPPTLAPLQKHCTGHSSSETCNSCLLPMQPSIGEDGAEQPAPPHIPPGTRMPSPGSSAPLHCQHELSFQQCNADISLPDPLLLPNTNTGSETACHDSS